MKKSSNKTHFAEIAPDNQFEILTYLPIKDIVQFSFLNKNAKDIATRVLAQRKDEVDSFKNALERSKQHAKVKAVSLECIIERKDQPFNVNLCGEWELKDFLKDTLQKKSRNLNAKVYDLTISKEEYQFNMEKIALDEKWENNTIYHGITIFILSPIKDEKKRINFINSVINSHGNRALIFSVPYKISEDNNNINDHVIFLKTNKPADVLDEIVKKIEYLYSLNNPPQKVKDGKKDQNKCLMM